MKRNLLAMMAILALLTLACGLPGGLLGKDDEGTSEPLAAVGEGGEVSSSEEGEAPQVVQPHELDSYRLRLLWRAEDEADTEGATLIITEEWVKGPPEASHVVMSMAEYGEEPMPAVEMITIGTSAWIKMGDTWIQTEVDEAEGLTGDWADQVANAEGMKLLGHETVNGVRCKHYASQGETSFSFVDPEEGGTINLDAEGEVWVADEGGLPAVTIRQRARVKGGFFPMAVPGAAPGTDETATVYLEYDLTDINTAITVTPPTDAAQMPGLPATEPPPADPVAGGEAGESPSLPPPPAEIQTAVRAVDGMTMSLVPAGEFLMGDDGSPFAYERPAHLVFLEDYWIDQTEVTNAHYRGCIEAGACGVPFAWNDPNLNGDQQPVLVPWSGAEAYCRWAGGRLPSEAEWEKAARGTDGRLWPWGNTYEEGLANVTRPTDGYKHTAPVGMYPAGKSPYGLLDMAGNAAEWVADWYAADYYAQSPRHNPTGPSGGEDKVIRSTIANGGGGMEKCRTVARFSAAPEHARWHYGFRCVSDTQP